MKTKLVFRPSRNILLNVVITVLIATSLWGTQSVRGLGILPVDDVGSGILQFKSGFEGSTHIIGDFGGQTTAWIAGQDGTTGNWDSLRSGNHPEISWNLQAAGFFQGGRMDIVSDPVGGNNRVLRLQNNNGGRSQWELRQAIFWNDQGGPNQFDQQFYRYRMYIPSDIKSVASYNSWSKWYMIWESHAWHESYYPEGEKTRYGIYLRKRPNSNHWYFSVQQSRPAGCNGYDGPLNSTSCDVYWDNKSNGQEIAVPFNQWFTFEVFFKYHETDGEWFVAVTPEGGERQVVAHYQGQTKWDKKLHDQMLFKMYANSEYLSKLGEYSQYYDDLEIWSDYPPGYFTSDIGTSPLTPTQSITSTPISQIDSIPLSGLSWEAEQGQITPPLTVVDGVVSQNFLTSNPADGGRAAYRFNIQEEGEYIVKAIVSAADSVGNSFFVGIDKEPDLSMIWDIILTNGFEERTVSWREGASPDGNASTPKVFYFTPGEHSLIIRGREANTLLDKVEVVKVSVVQPTITAPTAGTLTPTNTSVPVVSSPTFTAVPTNGDSPSPLPGLSWEAEQGEITAPFTALNGIVSQNILTSNPVDSGRAAYRFSIQEAGEYIVKATVNAADAGRNSFFVGMDSEPDTSMIWDVIVTNGFEERTVSWREGAGPDGNASNPKIFYLTPGEHILIIRGREMSTLLDKIEVTKAQTVLPTATATVLATETADQVPTATQPSIQTPVSTATPSTTVSQTATTTATESSTVTPESNPTQVIDTNGIYVSPDGNDVNPGTLEQPYKTINKAASVVSAGDTVFVRDGIYVESVNINSSGTASAPIRFMAYSDEKPVIDGQGTLGTNYGYLLRLSGDYVEVSGIEVKNSAGMCVRLNGGHNKVSNLNVHHCYNNGILISGDYGIVEDNTVWQASQVNANGINGYGSSGISAGRYPDNGVIRNNLVYDNWGEGVSSFEATNTLIEGNEIHDNWSVNLYISDSTGVVARDNVIYTTSDSPVMQDSSGSKVGILMGDERCGPCSGNNTVTNNHVTGTRRNFYMGYSYNPGTSRPDLVITNNVFEESTFNANVRANSYSGNSWPGFVFEGNTIIQTDDLPPILDHTGIIDVGLNTVITQVQTPTLTPTATALPTYTETASPQPVNSPTPMPTATPASTETAIPTFTSQPTDTVPPTITNITNHNNTELLVTFSEDVGVTGSNTSNFRLNGASGGQIAIDSISYDSNSYTTTLTTNSGNPLPPDDYTLVVAGTTSITDLAGNRLDGNADGTGGDDFIYNFSQQSPPTESPTAGPTASPTMPTATATVPATETATQVPTATPTNTSTYTPTPTATFTNTPTATPIPPTPTSTLPLEMVYDDTDSAFYFSPEWHNRYDHKAYGSSFKRTISDGAYVTFDFTGQSFSVLYKSGWTYRGLDVYVDGVYIGYINERERGQGYQQRWDYPGQLPYGPHTLKLVFNSSKRHARSSLDAVIVR